MVVRFRRQRHASHFLGILRVPRDPIGEAGGAVTVGGDQILGGRGITPAEGRDRLAPCGRLAQREHAEREGHRRLGRDQSLIRAQPAERLDKEQCET